MTQLGSEECHSPVSLEALQAELVPQLQALVQAACDDVCPLAAAVVRRPRESVKLTRATHGPDLSWHAPVAVWLHLQQLARRGQCNQPACEAGDTPGVCFVPGADAVTLTTVSAFGSTRVRHLSDASAVADLLLEAMPSALLGRLVIDVRVQPGGSVFFTSAAAFAARSAAGLLLCRQCGFWFGGYRGLRTHLQVAHVAGYEASREQADDTRRALVACTAPVELRLLSGHYRALAAHATATARAVHPGLVAARGGELDVLRKMVDSGTCDPAATCDRHGSTALMYAAGGGHVSVCAYLIETCGVDAAYAQPDGRTAFMWAARNGHIAVCEYLLAEAGPGIAHAATRDGTTALHWACWQGHIAMCEWLLDVGGVNLHALNSYGCNASQWAAQAGDVRMLSWLAQRGLDLKIVNRNGHSALHKAAVKGHATACDWLLTHAGLGAAHMAPDGDGNTPQRMAAAEGFHDVADALHQHWARLTRIAAAE